MSLVDILCSLRYLSNVIVLENWLYLINILSIYLSIPLVHEHFGRWGKEAINFLKSLGDRSKDEYGQYNKKDFMSVSRRRISVALQKGNAKVILRKLERLIYAFSSLDLAFTDVQSYVH